MKVSTLIKKLEKIKEKHGDLEVHQQSEMTYEGYDRTRSVDVKEEERPRSMRKIVVLWGYE